MVLTTAELWPAGRKREYTMTLGTEIGKHGLASFQELVAFRQVTNYA